MGALEMQLERVDALEAQLCGPDRGQPVRAAVALQAIEERGIVRLELH
jgi:hypothetical protein